MVIWPTASHGHPAPSIRLSLEPDQTAMRMHLDWLCAPVRESRPKLRFEIAWDSPEIGPHNAKTFRLDQIDEAVEVACLVNSRGCNAYVGATLKRADTPPSGRTRAEHATVATCLPIDIDKEFVAGARGLASFAMPQLLTITGTVPETRGQLWLRLTPTEDLTLWGEILRNCAGSGGGDLGALGINRLMRLAGGVSYPPAKKRARGYIVESICGRFLRAPTYDLRDDQLPPTVHAIAPGSSTARQPGRARLPVNWVNVALVQSMLDALPLADAIDYGPWLRVGFALHDFDGGEVGLALWKRFSSACPEKAAAADFDGCWAWFDRPYSGRKITLGSLWAQAQAHGWRAPRRWDHSTSVAG